MAPTLFVLALFVFGGLQTYTMVERKHRKRWLRVDRAVEDARPEPFRRDAGPARTRPVLGLERAPKAIRRTALWSMYMGQMAIPGGLLGLFGLAFAGIGMVAIPGMILAIRIYMLGFKLLRRDPRAEQEARFLARFAVILNIVAVTLGIVLAAASGGELLALALVLAVYGAVSFAHARAMRHCADILAADRKLRVKNAAQVAAETAAGAREAQPQLH